MHKNKKVAITFLRSTRKGVNTKCNGHIPNFMFILQKIRIPMLRSIALIALVAAIIQPVWGQTYSISVPWTKSSSTELTTPYTLEQAIFFDKEALLPHYFELIPINLDATRSMS